MGAIDTVLGVQHAEWNYVLCAVFDLMEPAIRAEFHQQIVEFHQQIDHAATLVVDTWSPDTWSPVTCALQLLH